MKLLKFSVQNIGPYGNGITEIELDPDGGMWMVVGKNGAGKSTLIKTPKYLFYGKDERVKKEDVANRINKRGVVTGLCEKAPGEFIKIERGFSPTNLKLTHIKDDVVTDITKTGVNGNQAYVENELVRMPYNIFSNVVSLSINDFTSFLKMTPDEKRKIIDKIFGLDVINDMHKVVKEKLKYYRDNLLQLKSTHTTNLSNIELNISAKQDVINKQSSVNPEAIYAEIQQFSQSIDVINNNRATIEATLPEKKKELEYEEYKVNRVREAIYAINGDKNNYVSRLATISKSICPTCNSTINSGPEIDAEKARIQGELGEIDKKLVTYNEALRNIEASVANMKNSYNQQVTSINTLNSQIYSINMEISNREHQLASLKQATDQYDQMILQIQEANKAIEANITNIQNEMIVYEKLDKLYDKNGVKTIILNDYIPALNAEIEESLYELNFPYSLSFTSSFDPILKEMGREISTSTLSTGEMKRADIAVLVSIIKIMVAKYPQLNVFMLDEILSSIDQDGISDIISFLQQTVKKLRINLFMINHSPLPFEYFDNLITITKNGSFSSMNVEKL